MNAAIVRNAITIGGKKFAEIPVSQIVVDKAYQRALRARVQRIADNWNAEKCDALVVSFRDNKFYVVDGQHRYEAAKMCGVEYLVCQIYENLTQIDEARKFVQQNTEVSFLSPYDTFKANIMLNDPVDTAIKEVCEAFQLRIYDGFGKKPIGSMGALGLAREIVSAYGKEALEWIFQVLYDSGYTQLRGGSDSYVVGALRDAYVLHADDRDTAKETLVKFLQSCSPNVFMARAVHTYPEQNKRVAVALYVENNVLAADEKENGLSVVAA